MKTRLKTRTEGKSPEPVLGLPGNRLEVKIGREEVQKDLKLLELSPPPKITEKHRIFYKGFLKTPCTNKSFGTPCT